MMTTFPLSRRRVWRLWPGILLLVWLFWPVAETQAQPPPGTCVWPADYDDFYVWSEESPGGSLNLPVQAGQILRVEYLQTLSTEDVAAAAGLDTSRFGAEVYRLLYASSGMSTTLEAVSALLLIPTAAVTQDFPLLVYGHPTTGTADVCAPSRFDLSLNELLPWLAEGYVVVSSDYAGLGPPTSNPYGVGRIAGENLLDSARAALAFCDAERNIEAPAANNIILAGHSLGGQSVLFAQQRQPAYAAELNLRGSIAFAPNAELRYLAQRTVLDRRSPRLAPFLLAIESYRAHYQPDLPLSTWVQLPYADELPTRLEEQCILDLTTWVGFNAEPVFQPDILTQIRDGDWASLEPLTTFIDENTPGNFQSETPVLILHGAADAVVPIEVGQQLNDRLCAQDVPTTFKRYATLGHINITARALPDALAWAADRLAGRLPPNTCAAAPGGSGVLPQNGPYVLPVTLTGAQLIEFFGLPPTQIHAYAYRDGRRYEVPLQVDEVVATGQYVATEDGRLDQNDELVFLSSALGEQVKPGTLQDRARPGTLGVETGYEVAVSNPLNPGAQGWLYLSAQALPAAASPVPTLRFDSQTRRIHGETYRAGLPPFRFGFDHLTLNSDLDILDRTKVFLDCANIFICPVTEETMPLFSNQQVLKAGPVRLILRGGELLAYPNSLTWRKTFELPRGQTALARLSTDFNQAVSGATFFNHGLPAGVRVDGLPDDVPSLPLSPWWQLSTPTGTLVQVTQVDDTGGTVSNYYRDNLSLDPDDRGDQQHFGDVGYEVAYPQRSFSMEQHWFFLPDNQPSLGAELAALVQQPRQITVTVQTMMVFPGSTIYLPLSVK